MFGGIHDITFELDDLWTFDIATRSWIKLEDDSRNINTSQGAKINKSQPL